MLNMVNMLKRAASPGILKLIVSPYLKLKSKSGRLELSMHSACKLSTPKPPDTDFSLTYGTWCSRRFGSR